MTLAKGARPRATLPLLPILIGAGLLAGCQSAGDAAPPVARADDWRVVERLGEVRYLAPGTGSWAVAMPATPLPEGSRVVTGDGGRLILARASAHVSAGPASRFRLPEHAPATLEQTAGRVRYRMGAAPSFAVATPALAIEAQESVFDVTVAGAATEVAVERGRLRVATPGGEREIELGAGQSAEAGGQRALAFRGAAGQPLQPVERIILPALQPPSAPLPPPAAQPMAALQRRPALAPQPVLQPLPAFEPKPAVVEGQPPAPRLAAAGALANQASTSAAATIGSAAVIGATRPAISSTGSAVAPGVRPAAPTIAELPFAPPGTVAVAPERATVADDPAHDPALADRPAAEAIPEDPRLSFDRLTEGMVDGLPAYRPAREPPAHARAI